MGARDARSDRETDGAARRELPAVTLAVVAAGVLIGLIYLGSRGLRDFDSALVGYAVGTVFAVAAIVYRYTRWITRPPTWRYFRAGWVNFLSWQKFRRYTLLIPRAWWTDIFAQTFILHRGFKRWFAHMAIFWGVVLSCAITFPVESVAGWVLYHALDFTSVLLIAGLLVAMWRRVTDAGLLVTQRFGFDLLPLGLLFGRDAPGPRPVVSLSARLVPLKQPTAWVLSLFYFLTFGGFVAISVYLPTFLVDAFGLERGDAASRAAGFVVLATLTRPVGGALADRWGGAAVLNTTFIIVGLLPIILAFQPGIALITVSFLGMAAALGLGNGAVFKLVAETFPRETGTVTGLVGAAGGLGGFFPPILMSLVRDATGAYSIGFMLLSEIALGCLIVNLLVMQRRATALMPTR